MASSMLDDVRIFTEFIKLNIFFNILKLLNLFLKFILQISFFYIIMNRYEDEIMVRVLNKMHLFINNTY